MRWLTSDWHLGHANIIRFCSRPFTEKGYVDGALVDVPDVNRMNRAILDAMHSKLTPGEDELWILGDIAMGNLDQTLPLLEELPVPLVIVAGNHDRCHPYNGSKHERFIDRYTSLSNLKELILGNTHLDLANGTRVQVSHFPYAGDSTEFPDWVDRYTQYRPVDDGSWLLCGHVHDRWRVSGRMINVGVDAWGGEPISEAMIADLMAENPAELPTIPWNRAAEGA